MARVLVNMPSQYGGKPSGVARVAFHLLEQLLQGADHQFWLRSNWLKSDLPAPLRHSALNVLHIPRPKHVSLNMVQQLITIPRLCRKLKIDVIWNIDPFAGGCGRPTLTTVHDLYFQTMPKLYSVKSRAAMAFCCWISIPRSKKIVAISQETRTSVIKSFAKKPDDVLTIYNAPRPLEAVAKLPQERLVAEKYCLLIGNATVNKNFGMAISALAELQRQGLCLALLHVGDDHTGAISRAMEKEVDAPPLTRLQGISENDLARAYRDAVCLIVPSFVEGFCLPIVEAQAMGCPVIAANVSVMPEVAGSGALYFNPYSKLDLVLQLKKVMAEPELRAALIAHGHKNHLRFSWAKSANAYAALFTSLSQ